MLVRQLAYSIYEKSLMKNVMSGVIPKCVALVISDGDLVDREAMVKLLNFVVWCSELGVKEVSIYVSVTAMPKGITSTEKLMDCIYGQFSNTGFPVSLISSDAKKELKGDRQCKLIISIGYGGKHELTNAMKEIMMDIRSKKLKVDDINEKIVEEHLIFKCEPDLFIRTGEARLTDFLIWQAVYSELYFTDVNWEDFRKIDLLRAIRDYQYRQRRFGI
jgi:undecaprenyl diphosphate synthase